MTLMSAFPFRIGRSLQTTEDASAHAACTRTIVAFKVVVHNSPFAESKTHVVSQLSDKIGT